MKKQLQISTLAATLLITTCQAIPNNPPSYWQIFITFVYGDQQPQGNGDLAPTGVTEDDYIAQFRSDMNGRDHRYGPIIPLNEMQEMETAIKSNLRNIDLRDKDIANQIIRSILIEQVKKGTQRDLDALAREGFYTTREECRAISTSYENNIRVRLESIPHNLNGAAIAQYFGNERKNSLRNYFMNRNTYR
jgi:hypothetical protein